MDASGEFGEPLESSNLFAAESFATRLSRRDGTAWLALGGELDVFTTPKAREALEQAEAARPDALVLDLRGLEFLDSSGLAALLGAHERRRDAGLEPPKLLIRTSGSVAALFDTIGARDHLEIATDANELTANLS